jgi:hypothetical protein
MKLLFKTMVGVAILISALFICRPLVRSLWLQSHPPTYPSVIPTSQWKRFVSEEGKCRVLFPGSPSITNEILSAAGTNLCVSYFFVWADPQTEYSLNYCDYPIGLLNITPQQQFDISQSAVAKKFGPVVSQLDLNFKGYTARDFEFIAGGKANYAGKVRLVLDNRRLYQLTVIFLTNNPHVDDFKIFFDSFSISKEEKSNQAVVNSHDPAK